MIDFHCHLDLYLDPKAVIERIEREAIYVLAVTTTPLAWRGNLSLTAANKRIRVAVGLHPELVAERHKEVELVCEVLADTRYVGEIGLDGSPRFRASLELQTRVLDRILKECESRGGRILTLHSRGAAEKVLDAIARHPGCGVPVLHWFTGTSRSLERAVSLGCWFSIGQAMLETHKGRELVASMPRDRILTETDGPFTRVADGPTMPWHVETVEARLATLWGTSIFSTRQVLHANLARLVR